MSKLLPFISAMNMLIANPENYNPAEISKEPIQITQASSVQSEVRNFRQIETKNFKTAKESDIVECIPEPYKLYEDREEIYKILGFGNQEKFGPVDMYISKIGAKYYFFINYKNTPCVYSNYEFEVYYSLDSVQIIRVGSIDKITGKKLYTNMKIRNSENQFEIR